MHSRQCYEPVEFYRRGDSGMRLPLAHSSGLLDQYETSSQMSRRTTPSSESDRHGAVPRKRVPVACKRCRQRKIKCSGDDGHGGCSNCRNAGIRDCQFLRVASLSVNPDSLSHMAHLQATQQHLRSHTSHHRAYPYSHYSHSTVSHYHPYSRQSAYRHHNHGHQQMYTPTQNATAYASHPSTPCPPGLQSDYSNYGEGGSGVSWTRANSFSGYGGYAQEEVSAAQYGSQQPASFLLPGGDPMASSGTSYGVGMCSSSRSNSQAQLWGDGMQSAAPAGDSNYLNNVQDANVYETALTGTGSMARQAMIPYQINTSTNNDRVLPTPGSRHYSSGFSGSSTLDSLPLSALSHRSSIGWSTDSASSASHISSQTSATGSSTCHDFPGERSSIHRTNDPQDIPFNGLGFDYSPQQTKMSSNALPASNDSVSANCAYLLSKGMASQAIDSVNLNSSSTQDLPSHHQRCRTISQSSTPIVAQMSGSSTSNSIPQLHRQHTSTIKSRNHEPNINEISESTSQLDASSAPSYSSMSSSSSSILTATYNPKPSTTNSSTAPNHHSNTQSQQPCSSSPYPTSSSSAANATSYTNPTATGSGSSLSTANTSGVSGGCGYTSPPVTQPQQRGGGAAATPSVNNAGAAAPAAQSQTRVGAAAASGSAEAVSGGVNHAGGLGGGLGLFGYAGADGRAVGMSARQGYVHVGVGVAGGGAGGVMRGLGGSVGVGAGAGGVGAGADEYGGQMAGEVGAVGAGGAGSGTTSVSSMGYGLS